MHANYFLLACRTCTVHVLQARRWIMTGDYGGEEELLEAVISDGWADGGAGDCSRWRWQWNPVTAVALPLCRDTNRCPLPLLVYPFYPFSSFSPTVSLGFPVNILGFFVSQFRSFLSLRSRFLSLSSPLFLPFLSFSPPTLHLSEQYL